MKLESVDVLPKPKIELLGHLGCVPPSLDFACIRFQLESQPIFDGNREMNWVLIHEYS